MLLSIWYLSCIGVQMDTYVSVSIFVFISQILIHIRHENLYYIRKN